MKNLGLKNRVLPAVLVSLGLICASPAIAQKKQGGYLGLSLGKTYLETVEVSGVDPEFCQPIPCNIDTSTDSFKSGKIFAGYRFNRHFALEGSYVDFDEIKYTTPSSAETLKWRLKGYDIFAVGIIPVGNLDLFGKLGAIRWDADLDTIVDTGGGPTRARVKNKSTRSAYGIGVAYNWKRFGIRGEWENFSIDSVDRLDLVTLGFQFLF